MVNGNKPTHISILDDDDEVLNTLFPLYDPLPDDDDLDRQEIDLTIDDLDEDAELTSPRRDKKKCECGSSKTYGKNAVHTDYCPLYKKEK